MKKIVQKFRVAFIFSMMMFLLCGLLYPLSLTVVSQTFFPSHANGSLIEVNGNVVGSSLIGQDVSDERLFHCRPSAYNYNTYTQAQKENGEYTGVASGGSNYANSNPDLRNRIQEDIQEFLDKNPTISLEEIPSDLITASGSGLDPHISVASALVQVDRIANHTGLSIDSIKTMIDKHTQGKVFGIFGEETTNVVLMNIEIYQALGLL